jgi:hypothetical protein
MGGEKLHFFNDPSPSTCGLWDFWFALVFFAGFPDIRTLIHSQRFEWLKNHLMEIISWNFTFRDG